MPRSRPSATSIGQAPLCTSASSSASCLRSISGPVRPEVAHAQLLHGALARARDLEAPPPRHYTITWLRHATEPLENEAGEGLVLALGQIPTKTLVDLEDGRPRAHEEDTGSHLPVELSWGIIFVLDLADNLLHEILDRHESDRASVLVDHQRHVPPLGLQSAEELRQRLRCGDEERLPHDRRDRLLEVDDAEEIENGDDADHVENALPEDRQAGEPELANERERLTVGGSIRDGAEDDLGQRRISRRHVGSRQDER